MTLTLPISKRGKKRVLDTEAGEPTRVRLKTCLAHAPESFRRAAGFIGHGGGGRPKKPTVPQVLRQIVENAAGEVIQPFFDGLQAERPVVVGNGVHATLEMVPDPSVRIRAADGILDRVYGRPKQTTELTGADGGAVAVHVPSTEERKAAVADVLREAGVS